MKKKFNRGFTLIELLVVIAIIGILASVILASLSSARAKGTDAATKSDLSNARAQAEIFYDIGNTYQGVCTTPVANSGIQDMITDAASKLGYPAATGVTNTAAVSITQVACHNSAAGWAAAVWLKSISGTAQYYCVDSNGATKQDASGLLTGAGTVTCS